jgi:tetraacyldisaccharide 4'-kinase
VVVAAETAREPMWPLPAGPWREGLSALGRCDGVVVTAKVAPAAEAERLARALAPRTRSGLGAAVALEIARLVPLAGAGEAMEPGWVAGRDVVAVSGIGDPRPFAAGLERLGARVRPLAFGDHHRYRAADVTRVVALAGSDGVVVTTAKDAVRLRPLWPAAAPPCLVAELEVRVMFGRDGLERLLDRVGRAVHAPTTPVAATEPRDGRNTL